MLRLLDVLEWQSFMAGCDIVITGAQEDYPEYGEAHKEGRALDLRSKGFPNPRALVVNLEKLGYDVRYGDVDHMDHIHVGIPKDWK